MSPRDSIWEQHLGARGWSFFPEYREVFFFKERQPQKIGFPPKKCQSRGFQSKKRKHNLSNSYDLLKFAACFFKKNRCPQLIFPVNSPRFNQTDRIRTPLVICVWSINSDFHRDKLINPNSLEVYIYIYSTIGRGIGPL